MLTAVIACGGLNLGAAEIYFSFDGERAGVGRVIVFDDQIKTVEEVAIDVPILAPYKLARAGGTIAVAVGGDQQPGLLLLSPNEAPRIIPLSAEVSDLAASESAFVVAASKGLFFVVDAGSGEILSTLDARKALSPPGRKGEHLLLLPGSRRALVSFQKDDDNSTSTGNRLVLVDVDPLAVRADMPLPRDREDLHIALDPKESGPGPEVMVACAQANTLAITLDLYGAVAFTDLAAAMEGRLENLVLKPTSLDDTWGTAFPDRIALVERAGRDFLFVANASKDGGICLFDVAARKRVAHYPMAAGADMPVVFHAAGVAATVVSGKIKARGSDGLRKSEKPDTAIYLFDLTPLDGGKPPTMRRIELGAPTFRIAKAGPGHALVFTEGEILLVCIKTASVVSRSVSPGRSVRALGVSD